MSKLSSMAKRIRELEAQIKRLKPIRSPGTMTSHTTRGTGRRATVTQSTGNNEDTAPRWA